jgi:hypothetical protein
MIAKVRMKVDEPIEIRFHSSSTDKNWQLVASVNTNGTVSYTLYSIPHTANTYSLTNLVGESDQVLPRKTYTDWQNDVINWVSTLRTKHTTIYEIDEVF